MAGVCTRWVLVGGFVFFVSSTASADQLAVDAGVQLESRNFDGAFVEQAGNVLSFSGSAMPMAYASAQVWISQSIGVSTYMARTIDQRAETEFDEELGTSLSDARVDGAWRTTSGAYALAAELGAGRTRMTFESSDIRFFVPADMPEIDYRYLRAGVLGSYDQGFATLHAGIGASAGKDHGIVSKYLGERITGVDFSLGASAELSNAVELRFALNLRDVYHFETDVSDDRFYGARLTLAYTR